MTLSLLYGAKNSAQMAQQENAIFHVSGRWGLKAWTMDDVPTTLAVLSSILHEYCEDFIVQLEKAESGLLHYQMYLNMKDKIRPKTLAIKWEGLGLHGIELSASSNAGKEALKRYAMKDESRVAGPWGKKKIYMGEDLPTDQQLMAWQKDIIAYIGHDPHDREILWLWEPEGGIGKTKFCKLLQAKHGAGVISWGNSGDILYAVNNMGPKSVYVFDLTRTKSDKIGDSEVYAALEQVKNGMVFNTKYESKTMLMAPPHVIVFSNEKPDTEKMSKDRWTIKRIPRQQINIAKKRRFTWTETENDKKKEKKAETPVELESQR